MTASKYQAEWKIFDKNEAFWNEVLVGRRIIGAGHDGLSPGRAKRADGSDLVARFSITLDTQEVVYLPGDPDWGDLDLIAPAPAGPVMQRIQRLAWDDIGIAEIVLQTGSIKLDRTWKGRGRLWIQDGWDRPGSVSGPPPGVDPIAEEVDKQILKDIEAQAIYRIELPESISEEEAQALVARVRAELEAEGIKLKPDDGTLTLEYVSGEVPKPEMVGFVASQDVAYTGELAASLRRAGAESDPEVEQRMLPRLRQEDHADIAALRAIPDSDFIAATDKAIARIKGIPAQQIILDEAASFREVELDTGGRAGTLDAPKPTEGYTRTCRTCGKAMLHQAWSSSDGAHEDSKYTCPDGHVEWVDGIDS